MDQCGSLCVFVYVCVCVLLTPFSVSKCAGAPGCKQAGLSDPVGRGGGVNTSGALGFRGAVCLCSVSHSPVDSDGL